MLYSVTRNTYVGLSSHHYPVSSTGKYHLYDYPTLTLSLFYICGWIAEWLNNNLTILCVQFSVLCSLFSCLYVSMVVLLPPWRNTVKY